MERSAPMDESIPLCEGCGYALAGLAEDGRCPECGRAIAESTSISRRRPPAWEQAQGLGTFLLATWQVLTGPRHFFRTLQTRSGTRQSRVFARVHWGISSFLLALAASWHWDWYLGGVLWRASWRSNVQPFVFWAVIYGAFAGISALAGRLTAWEAGYRGLRLPYEVVRRAMDYHSAHYLPVAGLLFGTIWGGTFAVVSGILPVTAISYSIYIGVLCAEVVISGVYLFVGYWIAMRQIMYANR